MPRAAIAAVAALVLACSAAEGGDSVARQQTAAGSAGSALGGSAAGTGGAPTGAGSGTTGGAGAAQAGAAGQPPAGGGGSGGALQGGTAGAGGMAPSAGGGAGGAPQAGSGGTAAGGAGAGGTGPDPLEPKPVPGCPGYVSVFVPKGTCAWYHGKFTLQVPGCGIADPPEDTCAVVSAVSKDITSIVSTSALIDRFDFDQSGCPKTCQ